MTPNWEERDGWASLPRDPSHDKGPRKRVIFAFYASLILFVAIAAVLAFRAMDYRAAREEYAVYQAADNQMAAFFESTEPKPEQILLPELPANTEAMYVPAPAIVPSSVVAPFYSDKVASLKKENKDTVGWLDIVGTQIQYPLVQAKDNEYYMTRTFKKKKNESGAIFLDCWNAKDFSDFNTVIYGHNMKDGSMFNGLREYRYQWFFDKHSMIEITLQDKKLHYQVFAAYTSQGEDTADFRGQSCVTQEQRSAFIKAARKRSTELESSLSVSRNDRLLTLVTCTSGSHSWYWVVHAVLVEEEV